MLWKCEGEKQTCYVTSGDEPLTYTVGPRVCILLMADSDSTFVLLDISEYLYPLPFKVVKFSVWLQKLFAND